MIIIQETTIGFRPMEDYEAHKKFLEENDVSEFKVEESTTLIAYTKKDVVEWK